MVIGKGIPIDPKILLMDEPSHGIDVGTKAGAFDIINQHAGRGLTALVIPSELRETLMIADRTTVLPNGKKTAELTGDEITEDNLVMAPYQGYHSQASGT